MSLPDAFTIPINPYEMELYGATPTERMRAFVLRREFYGAVEGTQEARDLLSKLMSASGLGRPLRRLSAHGDEFRSATGIAGIVGLLELWNAGELTDMLTDTMVSRIEALVAHFEPAAEAYLRARRDQNVPDRVRAWVCDLGWPWPSLAHELIDFFFRAMLEFVTGLSTRAALLVPSDRQTVLEPVQAEFAAAEGEDLNETLDRLSRFYRAVQVALREHSTQAVVVSERDKESLRWDARWLVASVLQKTSIGTLARERFGAPQGDARRKDIRDGIAEARRLLMLNPWRFDPGGTVFEEGSPGGNDETRSFPRLTDGPAS